MTLFSVDTQESLWEKKYNKLATNHTELSRRLIEAEKKLATKGVISQSDDDSLTELQEWKDAYTEIVDVAAQAKVTLLEKLKVLSNENDG